MSKNILLLALIGGGIYYLSTMKSSSNEVAYEPPKRSTQINPKAPPPQTPHQWELFGSTIPMTTYDI